MSSWSKKCGLVVCLVLSSVAGCTAPVAVTDGGSWDAPTGDRVSKPSPDVALADGGTCVDRDNDGHPSAACGGDDCDDDNPRRNPSAREVCDAMGVDEDCNPCTVGEALPGGVGGDGDRDEDGFASTSCFNRLSPGQPRPTCAGSTPDGGARVDRVSISASEVRGVDCDDAPGTGPTRFPGANEVCNRVDDNCDGAVDEGPPGPMGEPTSLQLRCYVDRDGDGFGSVMDASPMTACGACPNGYSLTNTDCNDAPGAGRAINPSAMELCDDAGVDENCNGAVNADERRVDPSFQCSCTVPSSRACCSGRGTQICLMSATGGTFGACSVSPTAESCNGVDDNCDGTIDNGATCTGGQACTSGTCRCPSGQALCGTTCQSAPGQPCVTSCMSTGATICEASGVRCNVPTEACNNRDDDCDGLVDETFACRLGTTRYCQRCFTGGPRFRLPVAGTQMCTSSCSYDPTCSIAATFDHTCDGVDDDCNGAVDDRNQSCLVTVFRGYAATAPGPTRVYTRLDGSLLPMYGLSDDRRHFRLYPARAGAAQMPVYRCDIRGPRNHVCFGSCSPGTALETLGYAFHDDPADATGLGGMLELVHLVHPSGDELYTADRAEISSLLASGWRRAPHPCSGSPFAGRDVAGYVFGPTRP